MVLDVRVRTIEPLYADREDVTAGPGTIAEVRRHQITSMGTTPFELPAEVAWEPVEVDAVAADGSGWAGVACEVAHTRTRPTLRVQVLASIPDAQGLCRVPTASGEVVDLPVRLVTRPEVEVRAAEE